MALIYNAYHGNLHLREAANTVFHGVFWYGAARIAAAAVSQISGEPTIDMMAQMADAYAPFIGAIGAARYAYGSPDNFTRIVIGPITLGAVGLGLGTGISNTPQTHIAALDDIVMSAKKLTDNPTSLLGLNGTHLLGISGLIAGIYNNIRRRTPVNNPAPNNPPGTNPAATP